MIICASGHRPNKLGGYTVEAKVLLRNLAIQYLWQQRPAKVISGMALGWDTAFAEAAVILRIPFVAAIPFEGQELAWPPASQHTFHHLCRQAAEIVHVSPPPYEAYKMQVRNKWMVDNSDRVCALYDGTSGGTENCIKYAQKLGRPIDNLWPHFCA